MIMPMWWLKLWSKVAPSRKVVTVDGDEITTKIHGRNLYIAQEDGILWEAVFRCPCGCGDKIELQLIPEASPNWKIEISEYGKPTLYPSVFRKTGCKAHFWLKDGRIFWV